MEVALIARSPVFVLFWRSIAWSAKFEIAAAAFATAADQEPLAELVELAHRAGLEIRHASPARDFQHQVLAATPVYELAASVLAILRLYLALARVVLEGIDIRDRLQVYGCAIAAIGTRRPLHELHLLKSRATVASPLSKKTALLRNSKKNIFLTP